MFGYETTSAYGSILDLSAMCLRVIGCATIYDYPTSIFMNLICYQLPIPIRSSVKCINQLGAMATYVRVPASSTCAVILSQVHADTHVAMEISSCPIAE